MDNLPPDNEIKGKVIDLASRIKDARPESLTPTQPEQDRNSESADNKGSRVGAEFMANVIAGGLVGYGVDWLLGTLPWGLLFFIVMGFVSAVLRANAAMRDE